MSLKIPVKILEHAEGLPLPKHATMQSAGTDLLAAVKETIIINPQQRAMIPTGITMAIPEGYEGQVRSRSGLAIKHGITVLNAPGTIDSDYRDEVKVILVNFGEAPYEVMRGMRIAQLVIAKYETVALSVIQSNEPLGEKERKGGFGSTGI
jgi:dUTP pyrophosphatase